MAEIPQELLSALSGDVETVARFAGMKEEEKEQVLQRVRNAHSAHEISHIVSRL